MSENNKDVEVREKVEALEAQWQQEETEAQHFYHPSDPDSGRPKSKWWLEFLSQGERSSTGTEGVSLADPDLPLETSDEERKRVVLTMAERIRSRRVSLGWHQRELAERMGVTRAAATSWESGRVSVHVGDLPRLGRVMGVPPLWFLGEHGAADPLTDAVSEALSELDGGDREFVLDLIGRLRARLVGARESEKPAEPGEK